MSISTQLILAIRYQYNDSNNQSIIVLTSVNLCAHNHSSHQNTDEAEMINLRAEAREELLADIAARKLALITVETEAGHEYQRKLANALSLLAEDAVSENRRYANLAKVYLARQSA